MYTTDNSTYSFNQYIIYRQYMCTCMYVYMYVCLYIHVCTCTCMQYMYYTCLLHVCRQYYVQYVVHVVPVLRYYTYVVHDILLLAVRVLSVVHSCVCVYPVHIFIILYVYTAVVHVPHVVHVAYRRYMTCTYKCMYVCMYVLVLIFSHTVRVHVPLTKCTYVYTAGIHVGLTVDVEAIMPPKLELRTSLRTSCRRTSS